MLIQFHPSTPRSSQLYPSTCTSFNYVQCSFNYVQCTYTPSSYVLVLVRIYQYILWRPVISIQLCPVLIQLCPLHSAHARSTFSYVQVPAVQSDPSSTFSYVPGVHPDPSSTVTFCDVLLHAVFLYNLSSVCLIYQ